MLRVFVPHRSWYFEISVPPFLGVSFLNGSSSGMGHIATHVQIKWNIKKWKNEHQKHSAASFFVMSPPPHDVEDRHVLFIFVFLVNNISQPPFFFPGPFFSQMSVGTPPFVVSEQHIGSYYGGGGNRIFKRIDCMWKVPLQSRMVHAGISLTCPLTFIFLGWCILISGCHRSSIVQLHTDMTLNLFNVLWNDLSRFAMDCAPTSDEMAHH